MDDVPKSFVMTWGLSGGWSTWGLSRRLEASSQLAGGVCGAREEGEGHLELSDPGELVDRRNVDSKQMTWRRWVGILDPSLLELPSKVVVQSICADQVEFAFFAGLANDVLVLQGTKTGRCLLSLLLL